MDLKALDSATKYPSIETYHKLGDKGRLTEEPNFTFEGDALLTLKVDGTNVRIIHLPDGDWFIGVREHLLYGRGDRVRNAFEGVLDHLIPVAEGLAPHGGDMVQVYYLEVYGGTVGSQAKQYSASRLMGHRLFDVALVPLEVLQRPVTEISSWRQNGGQGFFNESMLRRFADAEGFALTPRLDVLDAQDLPTSLDGMDRLLRKTDYRMGEVVLDEGAGAVPEGVVVRTLDRRTIAKARLQDYERTLRAPSGKGR